MHGLSGPFWPLGVAFGGKFWIVMDDAIFGGKPANDIKKC